MRGGTSMELVWMRSNFHRWVSKIFMLSLGSNFCWGGVEHSTIFIYYPTCADEVKLVQIRSGIASTTFICYVACTCRWGQTCSCMRGGTQYGIHFLQAALLAWAACIGPMLSKRETSITELRACRIKSGISLSPVCSVSCTLPLLPRLRSPCGTIPFNSQCSLFWALVFPPPNQLKMVGHHWFW